MMMELRLPQTLCPNLICAYHAKKMGNQAKKKSYVTLQGLTSKEKKNFVARHMSLYLNEDKRIINLCINGCTIFLFKLILK